jgi:hypothetical protein
VPRKQCANSAGRARDGGSMKAPKTRGLGAFPAQHATDLLRVLVGGALDITGAGFDGVDVRGPCG